MAYIIVGMKKNAGVEPLQCEKEALSVYCFSQFLQAFLNIGSR